MVDTPVEEVILRFTGPAEPAGQGFQLLDPSGEIREPVEATSVDGSTWVLRFDPPIEGGSAALRWSVAAADSHPIEGSVSFSVNAASTPPSAPAPAPETGDGAEMTDGPTDAPSAEVSEGSPPDTDLAAFLEPDSAAPLAGAVATAGRTITVVATMLAFGALVFAGAVLRGSRAEVRRLFHWVRRAGVAVLVGTLIEFAAQVAQQGAGWASLLDPSVIWSVLTTSFGAATVLRLLGATMVLVGARAETARGSELKDPVASIRVRVPVGVGGVGSPPVGEAFANESSDERVVAAARDTYGWRPTPRSAMAVLGAAVLLVAHLFDGHTVTEGNRTLMAIAAVVHVAGAAVWVGGIAMLADVLRRRRRQGRPSGAFELGVRFSVVASLAIVAVGVAGLVLTAVVLDSPAELVTTGWGRVLVAKVLFVAAAGAAGAYNHRVVVPELDRGADPTETGERFRSVVNAEVLLLGVVLVLTAVLMGAAS